MKSNYPVMGLLMAYGKMVTTLTIKNNVLFDNVMNKGFRYVNGTMKSYGQANKGVSYCYHKRIVC